jgi:membrane protein YdbS with pleckstrin-like domain
MAGLVHPAGLTSVMAEAVHPAGDRRGDRRQARTMAIDMTSSSPGPVLREPSQRVSPRAVRYWLARAAVLWTVVVGVQVAWLVYSISQPEPVAAWHLPLLVASVVLAAGHVGLMPQWRYRVHRWEITEHAVYTQTGWFRIERRIAPLSRVQTVDTDQGLVARLFGLAKVTVTTASAAGPLEIEGLDRAVAADLVDRLTAATEGQQGDAT